jgi:hypothetical protein
MEIDKIEESERANSQKNTLESKVANKGGVRSPPLMPPSSSALSNGSTAKKSKIS